MASLGPWGREVLLGPAALSDRWVHVEREEPEVQAARLAWLGALDPVVLLALSDLVDLPERAQLQALARPDSASRT